MHPDFSSNSTCSRKLIKYFASGDSSPRKSDTEISKRENKKRNDDDQSKLHAQLPAKQPVVVASSWPGDDDETAEIIEKLTEKLNLSSDQAKTVEFYLEQDGKEYVLEKVRITRRLYYGDAEAVLYDMDELIMDDKPPHRRVRTSPMRNPNKPSILDHCEMIK